MTASCGFLEDEKNGSERKSEREKVQSEILAHQEEKSFSKELGEGQEVVTSGYDAARTWRVHAVWMAPTERLTLRRQMAAAAGKKSTTSLSLFMEAFGIEVEEELSTIITQSWAEGVLTGKWCHEQKEAWMRQIQEVRMW